MKRYGKRLALGLLLIASLVAGYWALSEAGLLSILMDEERLQGEIERLGYWGPLAIIVLMVAAIVMTPIPSGPIAMVAGAAYGPFLGTVYVVIGAEGGALVAFCIARRFGHDTVQRYLKGRLSFLTCSRSQTWLMAAVFVSRLVPFLSFDAISYAAGLTPLAFWRFAVATLAGVVPVAFLFTYLGRELIAADAERILLWPCW